MDIIETLQYLESARENGISKDGVTIYPMAKIIGSKTLELGTHIIIDDFVFLQCGKRTKLGSHTHIASHASIIGGGEFILGDFGSISTGCRIVTGSDDFFGGGLHNPTTDLKYRNVNRSFVHIGRHAVLGAGVIVLPGVTVGEGCSVGAGSVVTKDLPPWSICVGTPCHKIKDKPSEKVLALEKAVLAENDEL